jgi:hypothetical protein
MLAFWHDRAPPQTPLGVHFIDIAGGLLGLGSGLLGVLVVGLDVLGHDLALLGKNLDRKSIRFS